jgi:hypothetical protein
MSIQRPFETSNKNDTCPDAVPSWGQPINENNVWDMMMEKNPLLLLRQAMKGFCLPDTIEENSRSFPSSDDSYVLISAPHSTEESLSQRSIQTNESDLDENEAIHDDPRGKSFIDRASIGIEIILITVLVLFLTFKGLQRSGVDYDLYVLTKGKMENNVIFVPPHKQALVDQQQEICKINDDYPRFIQAHCLCASHT